MELIAGPLDETGHAGVGVLIRQPGRGQDIDCISEEGRQARAQGRLILARVDTARGYEVVVASVYCWSGGGGRSNLRDKTNALIRALRVELQALRNFPALVSMDLNGDISDFTEME